MNISDLPAFNASLNALSAVLLWFGRQAIQGGNRLRHQRLMLCALSSSALFLASYLYYHFHHAMTRYPSSGWDQWVYYAILATHVPLAILMLPFIGLALWHAHRGDFQKHVQITHRVWPVWMYVSVSGVVIYLMLYQL